MSKAGDQDFQGRQGISNLAPATNPGQPLTWEQRGGGTVNIVELNFGSTPVRSKKFSVSHPGALVGQHVRISMSGIMPPGVAFDEFEMDSIVAIATVSAPDTIRVVARSSGFITRSRNFIYQVG